MLGKQAVKQPYNDRKIVGNPFAVPPVQRSFYHPSPTQMNGAELDQQHPVDHTKGHAVDCSNLNFPPRMSMGTAASRTATSLSVDSRQISTAAASTRDGTSRAGLRSGGHCPASRALERVGPGLQSTVSTMSLSTPPQCVADHNVEQDDRDKPVLARYIERFRSSTENSGTGMEIRNSDFWWLAPESSRLDSSAESMSSAAGISLASKSSGAATNEAASVESGHNSLSPIDSTQIRSCSKPLYATNPGKTVSQMVSSTCTNKVPLSAVASDTGDVENISKGHEGPGCAENYSRHPECDFMYRQVASEHWPPDGAMHSENANDSDILTRWRRQRRLHQLSQNSVTEHVRRPGYATSTVHYGGMASASMACLGMKNESLSLHHTMHPTDEVKAAHLSGLSPTRKVLGSQSSGAKLTFPHGGGEAAMPHTQMPCSTIASPQSSLSDNRSTGVESLQPLEYHLQPARKDLPGRRLLFTSKPSVTSMTEFDGILDSSPTAARCLLAQGKDGLTFSAASTVKPGNVSSPTSHPSSDDSSLSTIPVRLLSPHKLVSSSPPRPTRLHQSAHEDRTSASSPCQVISNISDTELQKACDSDELLQAMQEYLKCLHETKRKCDLFLRHTVSTPRSRPGSEVPSPS